MEQQIPLEVCPASNLCLGVAESLEKHPINTLLDAGCYITLNSDDPPMFNTTLNDEYRTTAETFGWDAGTLEMLSLNAVRAAVLPDATKETLETDFRTQFEALRSQYEL